MAQPTSNWLLEPIIPAPPALPRLDREMAKVADAQHSTAQYPSGTWRVGTHPEVASDDGERFATADAEAPTVRPGALYAFKR